MNPKGPLKLSKEDSLKEIWDDFQNGKEVPVIINRKKGAISHKNNRYSLKFEGEEPQELQNRKEARRLIRKYAVRSK